MLFSELYGAYYNCMADILRIAADHAPSAEEMQKIICGKGFAESSMNIIPAIREERYKLIRKDGTTPIRSVPQMPLTLLQKRWLKSVTLDPRFALFGEPIEGLEDIEPLFTPDDYDVFDSYADGDPYTDPLYREHFATVLKAVREHRSLDITSVSGKGHISRFIFRPDFIEYSEKDDKFRVIGVNKNGPRTVNVARILDASITETAVKGDIQRYRSNRSVTFELHDVRNALERVMLAFAHLQKEAGRLGDDLYKITLYYDKDDETEILIRILSFGPMIKVTEPQDFISLLKDRIRRQTDLLSN